ncbi:MAG: DUF1844 domain-containing protein [Deltaproteobacteria bacterium]|nr:DUF1844 domain-containing protein [Deltaproteobacteria bacterium]MBW2111632.1 DUF1844 domain-containing protein [Deltaproteobacteria bacterium]MBW2352756.1 DUF1844 domain-containing protein [Deltaproteobacteria bacterium]HDZ91516.1 DUF1844 domain-containing protein [Deltaproteobacteria bacterium]
MSEEEKGFVIKDRRAFDDKGKPKAEEPEGEKVEEKGEQVPPREEVKAPPLPEVNFSSLILSLSSTAFLHFGEIPDPVTGKKKKDLGLAKHTIDTIAMLKEKTEGNLTEDEKLFIENVLTDLRWRFVKAG